MRMPSPDFRTLGGRLLLGAVVVLLASPFDQGLTLARADNVKKPAPKPAPPAPNKKPPAKPALSLPKQHVHAHRHPPVLVAMRKLEAAWVDLEKASPALGRHQIVAMEYIVVAYQHLNAGIAGLPGPAVTHPVQLRALPQSSDYTLIRAALTNVHAAQTELLKATPLHGHRWAALVALNRTIKQLDDGLIYARKHNQ